MSHFSLQIPSTCTTLHINGYYSVPDPYGRPEGFLVYTASYTHDPVSPIGLTKASFFSMYSERNQLSIYQRFSLNAIHLFLDKDPR